MKLMSEEKLRELLLKAFEAGETRLELMRQQARGHAQGCPSMDDWDKRRDDTINQLIQNV